MLRWALPLVLWVIGAAAVFGQSVVADMSQNRVAITANFDGSEILIFGAITPGIDAAGEVDVIVTVSGPLAPVTVRKKDRVAGIWVNTEAVEIDLAPTIYKVNSTGPLSEILFETDDLRHSISIERAIRSVGAPEGIVDAQRFTDALIRVKQSQGLYRTREDAVSVQSGALFRTSVALPSNLVEGEYTTRIFLTRDRAVIAQYEQKIDVGKVGLERWLYLLAHENPLLYAALALFIAVAAGWGASEIFRYIRS